MSPDTLMVAPIILPLLGSALVLLCKSFFPLPLRRVAEYLGIFIGLFLPLLVLALLYPDLQEKKSMEMVIGGWDATVGIVYRFDGISALIILLGSVVTIPAWIYSRTVGPAHSSFTSLILIQSAAMAALGMSSDIFSLFVCLEIMGITAYVLVASNQKNKAILASFNYLMISSFAMVLYLLGTFGLYRLTGSLSYRGIEEALVGLKPQETLLAKLSIMLLVLPILLRVAVMPLSLWLVPAHSKAPHAVSAMLSGVLIKVPLFVLVRLMAIAEFGSTLALPLAYAGACSALLAVVYALAQKDAKQLLAYHSISQIGYVVAAWGLGLYLGLETMAGALLLTASFFHALSHGLFKALLFLSVGTATDAAHTRDVYTLRGANVHLKNRGEKLPLTMIAFAVGALSIMAIPPFNGYFSKTLLLYSVKGTPLAILLSMAGVGTVASFLKLGRIFLPQKNSHIITGEKKRFPFTLHLALGLLAIMCIVGGIFSNQIFSMINTLIAPTASQRYEIGSLYTQANITKTALTLAGGIAVFALIITKAGRTLLHRLEESRGSFTNLFFTFSMSLGALTLFLLYG